MNKKAKQKDEVVQKNPAKLFLYAYLITILIGGFLLALPVSTIGRESTNLVDALFTATSAVCVTGLTPVVTAAHWSAFGKVVILILIQLGGLGIITAAGAIGLLLNKRFSVQERMYLAEEKNTLSLQGMVKLLKYVIIATFTIEGIGAILLSIRFIPQYGLGRGIAYSIFHAISAFCNAGFDILGETSLMPYQSDVFVTLVISALIILSGLGFMVYSDILRVKKFMSLRLHTKIVLVSTAILLVVPTILFLIIEWSNVETIGQLSTSGKITSSFFQSVTTRTAGFFSIDQASLRNGSLLLTIALMFIGGAPAGTAGGLKVTTMVTLILAMVANVRKNKDVTAFRRRIPQDVVQKALTIFFISVLWIFMTLLVLSITENGLAITDLLYETISAYGTVGLSTGITGRLTELGKIAISFTMLFGKLGPITMVYAFARRTNNKAYREAEERILVG